MQDFEENKNSSTPPKLLINEYTPNPAKCHVCGGVLCPHGVCPKSEPEYACPECFCANCGADICEHGHCANYCDLGGDGPCLECWEKLCREKEAELEALWQQKVMGPMLGLGENE